MCRSKELATAETWLFWVYFEMREPNAAGAPYRVRSVFERALLHDMCVFFPSEILLCTRTLTCNSCFVFAAQGKTKADSVVIVHAL